MTLQQYKHLSEESQVYILEKNAVIIASLDVYDGLYTLFQVYGFYLEVCRYGKERLVSSISYFDETELLEPYLESINISPVYKVLNS